MAAATAARAKVATTAIRAGSDRTPRTGIREGAAACDMAESYGVEEPARWPSSPPGITRGGDGGIRGIARGVQLPSRDTGLGAHAPRGLPASHAGLREPLDRRPGRGHHGVVRVLRPGPGTHPPGAGSTRPRSPAAGPAHDDHDLAARRDRPVAREVGELAERPPHHGLVQLGQLPAHRSRAIRAAGLREVPQRGRGPARRLEQDAAALVGADPGQSLASLAPAAGQEPLERPARPREPRRGHGGQHGRRPGHRHHASTARGPGGDEPLARIGHHGRAGVRDERQVRAGGEVGQQVTLLARARSGRGSWWCGWRSRSGPGAGA